MIDEDLIEVRPTTQQRAAYLVELDELKAEGEDLLARAKPVSRADALEVWFATRTMTDYLRELGIPDPFIDGLAATFLAKTRLADPKITIWDAVDTVCADYRACAAAMPSWETTPVEQAVPSEWDGSLLGRLGEALSTGLSARAFATSGVGGMLAKDCEHPGPSCNHQTLCSALRLTSHFFSTVWAKDGIRPFLVAFRYPKDAGRVPAISAKGDVYLTLLWSGESEAFRCGLYDRGAPEAGIQGDPWWENAIKTWIRPTYEAALANQETAGAVAGET